MSLVSPASLLSLQWNFYLVFCCYGSLQSLYTLPRRTSDFYSIFQFDINISLNWACFFSFIKPLQLLKSLHFINRVIMIIFMLFIRQCFTFPMSFSSILLSPVWIISILINVILLNTRSYHLSSVIGNGIVFCQLSVSYSIPKSHLVVLLFSASWSTSCYSLYFPISSLSEILEQNNLTWQMILEYRSRGTEKGEIGRDKSQ